MIPNQVIDHLRMPSPRLNAGLGIMPAALSGWLHAFRIYTHPRVLGMLSLGFSAGLPLLLVLGTFHSGYEKPGSIAPLSAT